MTLSEALVRDFHEEADYTRKLLAAVPEDKLDWKPHEKSMSLAQLAGHLAENPDWVVAVKSDELDFADIEADYKPCVPESRAELLETFDTNARRLEEALSGMDDAFLSATWTMRHGDKVVLSKPRDEVVRSIGTNHMIHHRGQLTVYLRLLDVPIPATYGPTADQPQG